MRVLCHADQWPSRDGVLFPHRQTGTTDSVSSPCHDSHLSATWRVDRGVLFENLKQVQAWVPIDGTYDLGAGPRVDPAVQEQAYPLARCMSCCLCMEVCPQFTEPTRFVGAAIINQVRLFNLHPTGAHLRHDRLTAMMSDGGIHECSYAQNCVQICPKNIPLTTSISIVYGQVMRQAIGDLFQKTELTSARKEQGRR